jgi:hypothetical protein
MKDRDTNVLLEGAAFSAPVARDDIDVLADMERTATNSGDAYRLAAEAVALKWADVKGRSHVGLTIEDGGKQLLFMTVADVLLIPCMPPVTPAVVVDIYDATGKVSEPCIFLN